MPYSDKYKCILIHIPKTAGTSIISALSLTITGAHYKWNQYKKEYPNRWDKYFTFAVVRNPFDRLVSNYCFTQMDKNFWHNSIDPSSAPAGQHVDYDKIKGKSFTETVQMIDELWHPGWSDQYSFIYDGDELKVDFVIKMEEIKQQFPKLCQKLNIENPPSLPHLNASSSDSNYRKYYNHNLISIVRDHYKRDLEVFGYNF